MDNNLDKEKEEITNNETDIIDEDVEDIEVAENIVETAETQNEEVKAAEKIRYMAFLKLKIPHLLNFLGLSWEKYELVDCDYQFHKGIKRNGEVFTGLKGGILNVSINGTPSMPVLAWMFDHVKKFNGEVTIMDPWKKTIENIRFEQARLTGLLLHYKAGDEPNTVTKLSMVVESMQIGNAYFEKLNQ